MDRCCIEYAFSDFRSLLGIYTFVQKSLIRLKANLLGGISLSMLEVSRLWVS